MGLKNSELEKKLQSINELHHLIVKFSSRLIQSTIEQLDEGINDSLRMLGEYALVDRVYIFDYVASTDLLFNTYEWCNTGINPEKENLQGFPFSMVPRWREKFVRREYVYIPLVDEIDDQYHVEKEVLAPQGIKSLLAIPMYYGDNLIGFIGFDSVRSPRSWSEEHIDLLRLAGEIIAGSIYRAKFEREIIEARQQAEKANKTKSEFLASISHEIRTPMNAILGFSEILFNNATDPREKNFLTGILSSGRTLLYLINDILDLSKIEAGQMEIVAEPTRIADLINDVAKIFSGKIAEKNLTFRSIIDEQIPEVIMIDDVRLRQILFNLLGNAVKFTFSGTIELNAGFTVNEKKSDFIELKISVSDTGIGIPASYHQIIFDAFVQVETDNTRQFGGTGLGLAITKRLVQMMNGVLTLESQVEKGSTFTFTIPNLEIADQIIERKNMFEWFDKTITFEPATILVVDDVTFNRELAKSFLGAFGFKVYEVKNGQEGIIMAKTHKPDLILMDLRMPQMNGYQAVESLKSMPDTRNITCIAFTASSMRHDEKRIHSIFDGFLFKPITRNDLIDCLVKFLPHTIIDPKSTDTSGVALNRTPLPDSLAEDNERLHQLRDEIIQIIIPDLAKLRICLDSDIFENLLINMQSICSKYGITNFENVLNLLKIASENFDFELFSKEIQNFDRLIGQLINQQ
jgi:signal transduction histidine kinase/DNA-binding NarL/FixJ family response regulator